MTDGGVDQGGVHGKGRFDREVIIPEDGAGMGIEGIGVRCIEPGQLQEDARGKARPEACSIPGLQVAAPAHGTGA